MRRWLVLFALCAPNFTGCLYYAYPTLSHTPEVTVPRPSGSEYAYRVDIDTTEHKPLPASTRYTLSEIKLDSRGLVPSQLELAPATGVLDPLGIVGGGQHERSQYTMVVRLYKPGFQTVEVKAWEKSREVNWLPAPDLLAQEKAIDDLVADPAAPLGRPGVTMLAVERNPPTFTWWEQKDQKSPPLGLQPGAVAITHRLALQFAASEYERLAKTNPNAGSAAMQPVRARLIAKADWLRIYADKAPAP